MCWTDHDHTKHICIYVPFCIIFIILGSIQITSGIFFFISFPVIKLIINIGIGCWVVLTGIGGGMVACICTSTTKKHEIILYCSISILILNTVNLIYLEFGQLKDIFSEHVQMKLSKEYELLESENGRIITTVTAIVLVFVAFFESQINFYLLNKSQIARKKKRCIERKNRILYVVNDQSADLEYVIPKKNEPPKKCSSTAEEAVHIHNKSWVFEGTADDDDDQNYDESSVSLCSSTSPTRNNHHHQINHRSHQYHNSISGGGGGSNAGDDICCSTSAIISNGGGGTTSIGGGGIGGGGNSSSTNKRRFSRLSDANSERFTQQLTSFSRCATPSPVPRSGQITPVCSGIPYAGSNSISGEYIDLSNTLTGNSGLSSTTKTNRLTVDFVSTIVPKIKTINTYNSNNSNAQQSDDGQQQQEDSPYASLLAELEQSLHEKKIQTTSSFSPDNTSLTTSTTDKHLSSSKSSSKDLEFSKELEAALQLIQELETPSEGPMEHLTAQHHAQMLRSESEKTLSAAISLPSPEPVPISATHSSTILSPISATHSIYSPPPQLLSQTLVATAVTTTYPNHNNNNRLNHTTTIDIESPSSSSKSQQNGKQHQRLSYVLFNEPSSQSTSGYSSPNSSYLHSNKDLDHSDILLPPQYSNITNYYQPNNNNRGAYTNLINHQENNNNKALTTPSTPSTILPIKSTGIYKNVDGNCVGAGGGGGAVNNVHHNSNNYIANNNRNHNNNNANLNHHRNNCRDSNCSNQSCADGDDDVDDSINEPTATTPFIHTLNFNDSKLKQFMMANSCTPIALTSSKSSPVNKSFLLFKKRSKLMPQADFQNRIFKSECLAYLTEQELIERHHLNRNVVRKIEQDVARKVKDCQNINNNN